MFSSCSTANFRLSACFLVSVAICRRFSIAPSPEKARFKSASVTSCSSPSTVTAIKVSSVSWKDSKFSSSASLASSVGTSPSSSTSGVEASSSDAVSTISSSASSTAVSSSASCTGSALTIMEAAMSSIDMRCGVSAASRAIKISLHRPSSRCCEVLLEMCPRP